jgi:hypothetical protein
MNQNGQKEIVVPEGVPNQSFFFELLFFEATYKYILSLIFVGIFLLFFLFK